jgi:SP family xylose:H+ symportor-like MFS transporter
MSEGTLINSKYIIGISFISGLGGYLFGFDFAVISGALPFLKMAYHLSPAGEGFLTGSLALGCIVGSVTAGSVADRFGRLPGLFASAFIFLLSALGMAFAWSFYMFIIMRFCAGIGVGMASLLSPMYIAEISPGKIRGRNVAINQLMIVIGILITNVVNYLLSAKGEEAWRWMFGLGAVPALLFLIGLFWLPESPRWLMQHGHVNKAKNALLKIGNAQFAAETIHGITQSITETSQGTFKDVFQKGVRPAVLIGVTLAVFQQFCGINVVFNYTSSIFESAGANLNRQLLETVTLGCVNLVFTGIAMWQVDKFGRRPLMLIGSLGLSIIYLALAFILQNHLSSFLSLFVGLAIALYAVSLAPVTWVLISEIFPNKIRGQALSVAIGSLWAAYFLLVFTFPILAKRIGTYGPFYLYAGICLLGFLFIKRKVKETKGKTLEQVEDTFTVHH